MPYIKDNWRAHFDKEIEKLQFELKEFGLFERDGAANYVITRIIAGAMKPSHGWTYNAISNACRVFYDAEDEMRRRLLHPHEDRAIQRNGDIPEYEQP